MSGTSQLYGFDGTESVEAVLARPDKYGSLYKALSEPKFVIRGAGLSYCLATAAEGATTILTNCFNRILAFDAEAGTITAEPGLTVGELLDFAISRQLYFPVLPGYPQITIGGCAGFNVHGKTQFAIGNFVDFVVSFKLYHPLHGEIKCSRTENSELFFLTIGGFGLTGYISELTLKLLPLPGNAIKRTKIPVGNILEAVEAMRKAKGGNNILYSWNNFNTHGKSFGKGFVFSESFVNQQVKGADKPYGTITAHSRSKPNPLANGISFRAVPAAYQVMEAMAGTEVVLGLRQGSFPINGKEIYFKFFGKPGFREYQAIVSFETLEAFCAKLDALIKQYGIPVTLGSLKLFSGETQYLNFCATGVCITVDVPNYQQSTPLFAALDALVIEHKGIANISKDSRLDGPTVARMYPEHGLFKERLLRFDPEKRIVSNLRNRLDV